VQVQIGAPDVRGRKQILELYLSNVPLHQALRPPHPFRRKPTDFLPAIALHCLALPVPHRRRKDTPFTTCEYRPSILTVRELTEPCM
jgi:hypothetical protein